MPKLSANSYVVSVSRPISCPAVGTNLRHCVLNNLLVCHIGFVADKELIDALRGIAVDLLEPLLDVVE